ncbi:hypothetical protein [Flavihumibacter petaseus]|uniref:Uncharacterized protein n=1 Tax=Flavihumibacter petaseus NBRC 106054 TaxID=1220578 RepID=A0A0E9N153_9BACT|nr:hypothetical protein [Flavihumibacter petaseus]GAO43589.1 hypothetical protein FPE01S_02_06950 [Flavihumibacter petaseus NBRC 106054]
MNNSAPVLNKITFFIAIGLLGVFAVLTGFSRTFMLPVAAGTFSAPQVIYWHGALAFSWVLIFLTQALLVKAKRFHWHPRLGIAGIVVAIGTAFTMIPAGLFAVEKGLRDGLGQTAISSLFGVVTTAIMFLGLVLSGLFLRSQPAVHKRLMLLATLVLLWPAWFRFRHFFPGIPRPDIWFAVVLADSLIVAAWIWDKKTNGRVHPVLLYVGLFIIGEHTLEVICFDSEGWRQVSNYLYHLLS